MKNIKLNNSEILKNALTVAYKCAKAVQDEEIFEDFNGELVQVKSAEDYPYADYYAYPVIFYAGLKIGKQRTIEIIESVGLIATEAPECWEDALVIKGLHKNVAEYKYRTVNAFVETLKRFEIFAIICYTTDLNIFEIKQTNNYIEELKMDMFNDRNNSSEKPKELYTFIVEDSNGNVLERRTTDCIIAVVSDVGIKKESATSILQCFLTSCNSMTIHFALKHLMELYNVALDKNPEIKILQDIEKLMTNKGVKS